MSGASATKWYTVARMTSSMRAILFGKQFEAEMLLLAEASLKIGADELLAIVRAYLDTFWNLNPKLIDGPRPELGWTNFEARLPERGMSGPVRAIWITASPIDGVSHEVRSSETIGTIDVEEHLKPTKRRKGKCRIVVATAHHDDTIVWLFIMLTFQMLRNVAGIETAEQWCELVGLGKDGSPARGYHGALQIARQWPQSSLLASFAKGRWTGFNLLPGAVPEKDDHKTQAQIRYQLSATPEECAREIEQVRGNLRRAEGTGPIVRNKPPENPARKLRSIAERKRAGRRDDLSDVLDVQYTIKVPSTANRDFWVRLTVGDWDGTHSTLAIDGNDQAVQRAWKPFTEVLRAFVDRGWVVRPAGDARPRSWAGDIMSVLLDESARTQAAAERRAEQETHKLSFPTHRGDRETFRRIMIEEFGQAVPDRAWYVEPLQEDMFDELFGTLFTGLFDLSQYPPPLWSIRTHAGDGDIAWLREREHLGGLALKIDLIPSEGTSVFELEALCDSLKERLEFWHLLDTRPGYSSSVDDVQDAFRRARTRMMPTKRQSEETTSKGQHAAKRRRNKATPWDDSEQKITRLRRYRRDYWRAHGSIPKWTAACDSIPVDTQTVCTHAPELRRRWYDEKFEEP